MDLNNKVTVSTADVLPFLPEDQRKNIDALHLSGTFDINAAIKGHAQDWQNWSTDAKITTSKFTIMGYTLTDITVAAVQKEGKLSNLTADATAYEGKIHAVGSGNLVDKAMPFDLALNIDALDLKKLKSDIPNLKEDINGKFYLTTVGKGNLTDIKNLQAKGSMAIREGFLSEFKIFKGLFAVLNPLMHLGQVVITDVEGNFTIADQKINTDNLRLISPTIVFVTSGWVDFDLNCSLDIVVDMSSGRIPPIAEDVLRGIEVHVSEKIFDPKVALKNMVKQAITSVFSVLKATGILQ